MRLAHAKWLGFQWHIACSMLLDHLAGSDGQNIVQRGEMIGSKWHELREMVAMCFVCVGDVGGVGGACDTAPRISRNATKNLFARLQ